jgi:DEAD/DEAH box helicase domain-containing protein
VTPIDEFAAAGVPTHGEVHVVSRVVGFKKIKFYTNENVGSGELDLPEQQMHTTSYWLTIPAEIMAGLPYSAADRRDGVVGLAYAMRNVAPLLLMCDVHDLGLSIDGVALEGASRVGGSTKGAADPGGSAAPTIFLYDNYPGGIGFSEPLFGMHDPLAKAVASQLLAGMISVRVDERSRAPQPRYAGAE